MVANCSQNADGCPDAFVEGTPQIGDIASWTLHELPRRSGAHR